MPSTRKFLPETEGGLMAMVSELRRLLMDAADDTPTAAGLQLYSVVLVISPTVKKALMRACRKQKWIADASVLLVFCADISRFEKWLISNGERPHYRSETWLEVSKADTYIFAEAVSELLRKHGYGTCFSGFILNSAFTVGKILMTPGGVFPLLLMGVGTPDDSVPTITRRMMGTRFIHTEVFRDQGFNFKHIEERYSKQALELGISVPALFVNKFYPRDMVADGDAELEKARRKWLEGGVT
jgi:nitroreductase